MKWINEVINRRYLSKVWLFDFWTIRTKPSRWNLYAHPTSDITPILDLRWTTLHLRINSFLLWLFHSWVVLPDAGQVPQYNCCCMEFENQRTKKQKVTANSIAQTYAISLQTNTRLWPCEEDPAQPGASHNKQWLVYTALPKHPGLANNLLIHFYMLMLFCFFLHPHLCWLHHQQVLIINSIICWSSCLVPHTT